MDQRKEQYVSIWEENTQMPLVETSTGMQYKNLLIRNKNSILKCMKIYIGCLIRLHRIKLFFAFAYRTQFCGAQIGDALISVSIVTHFYGVLAILPVSRFYQFYGNIL